MESKSIEPIVQQRVNAFYAQYHRALEQQHLMEWVDMLDPNVSYRITSRENLQRGWPLCFVRCDNQGMAHDRACALLSSIYFRQRRQQHALSYIHITDIRREGGVMWVSVDTSLSVHESLNHDEARLLVTVTTHDKLRLDDQDARFTERLVICEPDVITDSLVYPL